MSSTYSLSIVVPVYNTPSDVLAQCLLSIQTAFNTKSSMLIRNVSVIIVNDASQISYDHLLSIYASECFEVVQLKHEVNRGRSEARNTGIGAADTDLIAFLDSDDELLECYFDAIADGIQGLGQDWDFLSFGYCLNNFPVRRRRSLISGSALTYAQSKYFHISSIILKRDQIGGAQFVPGLNAGEDVLFFSNIIEKNAGFHINRLVSRYRYDYKSYRFWRPKILVFVKYCFVYQVLGRFFPAGSVTRCC